MKTTGQNIASYVSFVLAHGLLGLAVWAAFREFTQAAKMRKNVKGDEADAPEQSEIKVSLEGIAIKTSFHGTLLLVIALVFYYLFLKFVYPISIVTS